MSTLIFGKWSAEDVKITDISLANHISLDFKQIPHSFGRAANLAHAKDKISIVERLINKTMRSGQGKRKLSGKYIRGRGGTGKKLQAMRIIENAFIKIENQTKLNPIQVLVQAIEHSAPREDITRIKKGGISYTVAVDVSPMKRIDESLKNIALAAFSQSFNNKTDASDALAREIIGASKDDSASFSIKRRNEVERIALGSR
jgi:small subunit ribosomal protein S7